MTFSLRSEDDVYVWKIDILSLILKLIVIEFILHVRFFQNWYNLFLEAA